MKHALSKVIITAEIKTCVQCPFQKYFKQEGSIKGRNYCEKNFKTVEPFESPPDWCPFRVYV